MDNIPDILTYVNTGGVVVVLIVVVRLFLSGDVISSKLLERIIRDTVVEVIEQLESRRQTLG